MIRKIEQIRLARRIHYEFHDEIVSIPQIGRAFPEEWYAVMYAVEYMLATGTAVPTSDGQLRVAGY